LSSHNKGGQYNTLIKDTNDFLDFLGIANINIGKKYNQMSRNMINALNDPNIEKKSYKLFDDNMVN
jgi:hypothetical protein